MRSPICRPVLIALGLAAACSAWAQSTSPNDAPSQFDSQSRQQRDRTLSERLDRSDGVIRPPSNVDPHMQVPPPATGDKMPIVPVPDGPGGSSTVKPK